MKITLITLFFLFPCRNGFTQQSFVKQWDKRFGGTNEDEISIILQNKYGEFILAGYSMSDSGGDKTQNNRDASLNTGDFWIVKVDAAGYKVWDKRFGGNSIDGIDALQFTKDGGYILGGMSYSDIGGDRSQPSYGGDDYWIVKIDSAGNKEWDASYGGTNDDLLHAIMPCGNGGYLFGGSSSSGIGGDKTQSLQPGSITDYWLVKTDSFGHKLWDIDYGSGELASVVQLSDGNYLLSGTSSAYTSSYKSQSTWGLDDYWAIKIDSAGNRIWDKDFGGSADDELTMSVATTDGGALLAGTSRSGISGNKTTNNCENPNNGGNYDYWIVKIDSLGNKQWDRDYGPAGSGGLNSALQTNDGGYLVAGSSSSALSGCAKTENNLGAMQTWVVKTDSLGLKQWDKTIFTTGFDYSGFAIETEDGCYAIANTNGDSIGGYKTQNNRDSTGNTTDFWMLKFCMYPTDIHEVVNSLQFSAYPNPFTHDISISISNQNLHQSTFTITNLLGQTIYTQNETNLSPTYTKMLDLSYLPNGVYWVSVVVDWERVTKEVVKAGP